MTPEAPAAEILGQLLAAQSALQFLTGSRQSGEFGAHALLIVPGVRATAARLGDEEVSDGEWGGSAPTFSCHEARGSYLWQAGDNGEQLLVLPVESLRGNFGCLCALAEDRARVEPYVAFMANFASSLALELDNKSQRSSSSRPMRNWPTARPSTSCCSAR